ncbi:MAG: hypothetical protein AABY95_09475 [Pseudomonadota bacterium]
MKKILLALLLSSLATVALGATPKKDGTHRFYGYAFDLETDAYLYTEVHTQKIAKGRWVGGSTTYYAPDGTRIGRKTIDFTRDPYVPVYTLEMSQSGYMEGVTDAGDPIRMQNRSETGEEIETGAIRREGDLVADSGFHTYLIDHFDQLQAGQTLHFKFVVSGRLDTFSFRARKVGDVTYEGQPAVRLEIAPDSILSIIVPDLYMLYDPNTRQMLEFRGTTNIPDPKTGKAYESRLVYPAKPPAGAPKKLPPLR